MEGGSKGTLVTVLGFLFPLGIGRFLQEILRVFAIEMLILNQSFITNKNN